MELSSVALVMLIVCAGSFLQVHIGLGLGILCMTLFPMLFPLSTAVGLNVAIASVSALYIMISYWKDIQWKTILPVTVISLTISTITTICSLQVEQGILKVILGIFLIFLSLYFAWFAEQIHIRPSVRNGVLMGSMAGIGNGLFGLGGPPVALYFMASMEDTRKYVVSIQTYFFFSNVTTVIVRAATGAFQVFHLPLIVVGWICAAVGTWIGLKTSGRLPERTLKRLAYLFIGLSGLILVLNSH